MSYHIDRSNAVEVNKPMIAVGCFPFQTGDAFITSVFPAELKEFFALDGPTLEVDVNGVDFGEARESHDRNASARTVIRRSCSWRASSAS
jgi:hypothetical protein